MFINAVCLALFLILLVTKLCGVPYSWLAVFSPLIIGFAITVAMLLVLFIVTFAEDRNEKE